MGLFPFWGEHAKVVHIIYTPSPSGSVHVAHFDPPWAYSRAQLDPMLRISLRVPLYEGPPRYG